MENNENVNGVVENVEVKEEVVDRNILMLEIEKLKLEIENAKLREESKVTDNAGKNHRPVKADPNRRYVLLAKPLANWGKVPQQQADIAAIIEESVEIGALWTEEELFSLITDSAKEYKSLRESVQHPTYLFCYYRGLDKKDGKHAGYIKRNFLRMTQV